MTFNHNGLHFEAYEGGLIVKRNGVVELQAIDVFRKGIPPKEKIIKFYEALQKMCEKKKMTMCGPCGTS